MAQMQPPIPLPVLRDLRCTHCRKFVTCGPVHVAPDSSILCGRCCHLAKKAYRNLAFEVIAAVFYYPCHYWPQHCNAKLRFGESLDHEHQCPMRGSCCHILCCSPGPCCKSDRKLPLTGGIQHEHVPDALLDHLTCLSCARYLSHGPVYVVMDGRNVCHRCIHANGYPPGAVRNLAYETIASAMVFPCVYRNRGCTFRMPFGGELWAHEHECPHNQQVSSKRVSKRLSKNGKERGVIETHSGHIWGTITPHSALFAPKARKDNEGQIVQQELVQMMRRKQRDDDATRSFDSQSMDSVASKSTYDSLDNISRSTMDNLSRFTVDNVSRASSNVRRGEEMVAPFNGYYRENLQEVNLPNHRASLNNPPGHRKDETVAVKKSESFRVGNRLIIEEIKQLQRRQHHVPEDNPYDQCNSLQDIVQQHDQVFTN